MSGKKIAIIDDEPAMVDMISTFLRLKGYQIHGAYNGYDGLSVIERESPDLLILDLMLPDLDGYTICQRVRAMPDHATMPVLVISARGDLAAMTKAEESGANGYMTKPVRFPDLLAELARLLA